MFSLPFLLLAANVVVVDFVIVVVVNVALALHVVTDYIKLWPINVFLRLLYADDFVVVVVVFDLLLLS